jgi:hypothetical protein
MACSRGGERNGPMAAEIESVTGVWSVAMGGILHYLYQVTLHSRLSWCILNFLN